MPGDSYFINKVEKFTVNSPEIMSLSTIDYTKYDCIISIGNKCPTAMILRKLNIYNESYPFDYIPTTPQLILNIGIEIEACKNYNVLDDIKLKYFIETSDMTIVCKKLDIVLPDELEELDSMVSNMFKYPYTTNIRRNLLTVEKSIITAEFHGIENEHFRKILLNCNKHILANILSKEHDLLIAKEGIKVFKLEIEKLDFEADKGLLDELQLKIKDKQLVIEKLQLEIEELQLEIKNFVKDIIHIYKLIKSGELSSSNTIIKKLFLILSNFLHLWRFKSPRYKNLVIIRRKTDMNSFLSLLKKALPKNFYKTLLQNNSGLSPVSNIDLTIFNIFCTAFLSLL
jgi:hypothetical protein